MPGTNLFSAIGGSTAAPVPQFFPDSKPGARALAKFGTKTIGDISAASDLAKLRSTDATARNDALLEQQAGIWQSLLQQPKLDALGMYGAVGDKLFSYIKPNVLDPIARADANRWSNDQRALGLNPAVLTGTARRLGEAAQSNRVYLDVAKSIFPQINPGFNQVFNAGLASNAAEVAKANYIPNLMSMYQSNALSPLAYPSAAVDLWNSAGNAYGNQGTNVAKNVYGYKQKQNAWDRVGAGVDGALGLVGQIASLYSGLGGTGMGSGEGGGIGNYSGPQGANYYPNVSSGGPGGTVQRGPNVGTGEGW